MQAAPAGGHTDLSERLVSAQPSQEPLLALSHPAQPRFFHVPQSVPMSGLHTEVLGDVATWHPNGSRSELEEGWALRPQEFS